MERQPIHLRLDGRDYFRMAMAQGEDAESAKAIDKLASRNVAQNATFPKPFNDRAGDRFRFRPAIQELIEAVYGLFDYA